ncbi:glycoside hydrolase 5 family protein [Parabacteroides pacaensis]|uniref:glycoside hydrolase 5 family protein n=1 Tax=Parabacteroides pacaensis TaxID=2086575 RepID=UPI000D109212|nr:beta-galactosidase [Parabacteroides pacaensis]
MKTRFIFIYCFIALSFNLLATSKNDFVYVEKGQFKVGNASYYYIGTNFWYGAILGSEGEGGDRERLTKELNFLSRNGICNLRILVGADGESRTNKVEPALQVSPGIYNDTILAGLDFLLMEMSKRNMRAVLYLNNAWEWSGGYSQYLEWAGCGKAPVPSVDGWNTFTQYVRQFVVNEKSKNLFRKHIKFMINRTNRYTHTKYKNDPTIMSWQIANEPRAFSEENKETFAQWIHETAAYIKKLDKNHLVSTGSEGMAGCEGDIRLWEKIHADPCIDYANIHIWPNNWGWIDKKTPQASVEKASENSLEYIEKHCALIQQYQKPVVLEEFGYPRDNFSFIPGSATTGRDTYYQTLFNLLYTNSRTQGNFAGCNFWAWGGSGRPSPKQVFWEKGYDYLGDPAQEEQGLNSVFDIDATMRVIRQYTGLLNSHKE